VGRATGLLTDSGKDLCYLLSRHSRRLSQRTQVRQLISAMLDSFHAMNFAGPGLAVWTLHQVCIELSSLSLSLKREAGSRESAV
jgi:hypothetical protein